MNWNLFKEDYFRNFRVCLVLISIDLVDRETLITRDLTLCNAYI